VLVRVPVRRVMVPAATRGSSFLDLGAEGAAVLLPFAGAGLWFTRHERCRRPRIAGYAPAVPGLLAAVTEDTEPTVAEAAREALLAIAVRAAGADRHVLHRLPAACAAPPRSKNCRPRHRGLAERIHRWMKNDEIMR